MDDQSSERDGGQIIAPVRLRQPHINSPLARRALIGFLGGFMLITAATVFRPSPPWSILIILPALLAMVGAAMIFALAILFRDAIAFKRNGWRYSLRTLLIATTLVAILLGLIVWLSK